MRSVKGWPWSGGLAYARSFDSFGRLASYPLGNPSGTGTAAGLLRTLGYDDAAQITAFTHTRSGAAQTSFNQSFGYDDLGQLRSNAQSTTSYSYSYDASGNRVQSVVGAASYAQTIAPTSNRLMQSQGASGTTSFSYDNAGNMLTDGAASTTYSDRGRMSSATIGANTVSYKFNGLDQRVSKTGPTAVVPSGAAYYAYDEAGQLIGEYDASVKPGFETIYLGTTPVAVLKQTGSASNSTLQVVAYNVWADHLDTPRVVTRSSDQAIVWRWDSAEAFGATAPNQNPNALGVFSYNQRFPGQLVDLETGNFYNWYRDYRAGVGRYVQSDPIGLKAGVNTYLYVSGNPISYVDSKGSIKLSGESLVGGASRGFGVAYGRYVLRSECVRGTRWEVEVEGQGALASVSPVVKAGGASKVEFEDGLDYINPYVFNGQWLVAGGGVAVGPWGTSWGATQLGGAFSNFGTGDYFGLDLTAVSAIIGTSKTIKAKPLYDSCECR